MTNLDLMKVYEINTGTHLENGNSLHDEYLNKYIEYLYTTTFECELEVSEENVKLLARHNRAYAATMFKAIKRCTAQEAIDYVENHLNSIKTE